MALKEILDVRLVTRLAVFFVMMMIVGMTVMGLLLQYSRSAGALLMGILIALAVSFPIGVWIVRWAMRPIFDIQVVAEHLLQSGGPLWGSFGKSTSLKTVLTQLASRSQERIYALERERTKISTILDSMVEGVIALDHHGRVIVMNPAARRILDAGREKVEGRQLLEVIRNRKLAEMVERSRTLGPNEQYRREVELYLPVHRILEVNAMPLPLQPTTRGIVLVLHDITELRRLERVRVEFVANVSHELRTPLTAIKGYLETLLDETPADPATQRRFLEVAHTQADRLGRLIKDLLNLSDIESGRVALHPKAIGLKEFVNETVTLFEKHAGMKSITFENRIASGLATQADPDRLSQILVNLVDNSVKYTPTGGKISFDAQDVPNAQVRLTVTDSGQGILPHDLARVTERFYRVDKARSREEGGTGLGLTIVKHLVQLHGGTLHITSEVGKGTMVEVVLPAAQLTPSF